MQCRTMLAHVWTMRPLLYHTVQDGAGPRLDHAPLAELQVQDGAGPHLGHAHFTVPHPVLYWM
jgi:hypothetical protein